MAALPRELSSGLGEAHCQNLLREDAPQDPTTLRRLAICDDTSGLDRLNYAALVSVEMANYH